MQFNWKKVMAGAVLSAALLGSSTIAPFTYTVEAASAAVQKGQAVANVNLRSKASSSSKIIGKIYKGTKVEVVSKTSTGSWYKVRTAAGTTGYASSKYIKITSTSTGTDTNTGTDSGSGTTDSQSEMIEKVISTGMKYLGTPYEYGSDRNTTTTFDCSDFVRHVYREAAGITLPSDSRQQGQWIKDKGTDVSSISKLKRGDLVFFRSSQSTSDRITHVAIYLGNDQLLHTYSQKSGGVLVGSFSSSWKNRFLFGGSVL